MLLRYSFVCSSFFLLLATSSGPFRFPSTVSRHRPKGIPRQLRVSSALPLSFFSLSFSVYYFLFLSLFLFLLEKQKNSETTSRITSVTFGNFHPFLPLLFVLSILLTPSLSYFLRNPGKAQRRRKDFSLSLPRRTLKFSRCTPRRIVSSVRFRF